VRFSQVFNVDNDPQTLIRQQAPNSELSADRMAILLKALDERGELELNCVIDLD